jgi:hypothetical protein
MGGYLEENRRIKALRIRGVESDGLWLPVASIGSWLSYLKGGSRTGVPVFKEGETLTDVKGHRLCGKYYTPATLRAMKSKAPREKKIAAKGASLPRHYDTPQLRSAQIPPGNVVITEKMHGTSGRTGYVMVDQPQHWFTRLLNKIPFVNVQPDQKREFVSGTRNCILDKNKPGEVGSGYRHMVHDMLVPYVRPGEVWYYELVGFTDTGTPIAARHTIDTGDKKLDKMLKSACGDQITYHYGCSPGGSMPGCAGDGSHRFKVLVYRITLGGKDMLWDGLFGRVLDTRLGDKHVRPYLDTVPVLAKYGQGSWVEADLRRDINEFTRGPGEFLPIKEGVCVRVESEKPALTTGRMPPAVVHRTMKHKSWVFCALEGIMRNDPDYVDSEEVA